MSHTKKCQAGNLFEYLIFVQLCSCRIFRILDIYNFHSTYTNFPKVSNVITEGSTAWKVSKYGGFFWSVFSSIFTENEKIHRTSLLLLSNNQKMAKFSYTLQNTSFTVRIFRDFRKLFNYWIILENLNRIKPLKRHLKSKNKFH